MADEALTEPPGLGSLSRLDKGWPMPYALNTYKEFTMPRPALEDHNRVALRIRPQDKATLLRAVALEKTDMTEFILGMAPGEANGH